MIDFYLLRTRSKPHVSIWIYWDPNGQVYISEANHYKEILIGPKTPEFEKQSIKCHSLVLKY